MKRLNNERGAALTYALIVFVVLAISVPVIIAMTSNAMDYSLKDVRERKANDYAVGGMESFIEYLGKYSPALNVSPYDYMGDFAKGSGGTVWDNDIKFKTPEGEDVVLDFNMIGNKDGQLEIVVEAKVSNAATSDASHKRIKYIFNSSSTIPTSAGGTGGGGAAPLTYVSTDINNRICVVPVTNTVYYQGGLTLNGNDSSHDLTGERFTGTNDTSIRDAIGTAINTHTSRVIGAIKATKDAIDATNASKAPAKTGETCTACMNQIDAGVINAMINNSTQQSPIVIRIPNNITITGPESIVWGSAARPVVIVAQNITMQSKASLTVHGDLLVNQLTYNSGSGSSLNVSGMFKSSSTPNIDSVSVKAGDIHVSNGGMNVSAPLAVTQDIYVNGSFSAGTSSTLTFRNLYADGSIQFNARSVNGDTVYGRDTIELNVPAGAGGSAAFNVKNMYSATKVEFKSGGPYVIDGMLFAGPLTGASLNQVLMTGGPIKLQANFIVANGEYTGNSNSPEITVGFHDKERNIKIVGDFIVRKADIASQSTINVPLGDMLTQTEFRVNGGSLDLTVGGHFAFGTQGTFNGGGNSDNTVTAGGHTSSFFMQGVTNVCGSASGPFDFSPRRA